MSLTAIITVEQAIATAEETLDGKYNDWPATLEFLALDDGSAALVHVVQIQNEATGAWVEAFVDAHNNKVVSITDFVAKASVRIHLSCMSRLSLTLQFTGSTVSFPSRKRF